MNKIREFNKLLEKTRRQNLSNEYLEENKYSVELALYLFQEIKSKESNNNNELGQYISQIFNRYKDDEYAISNLIAALLVLQIYAKEDKNDALEKAYIHSENMITNYIYFTYSEEKLKIFKWFNDRENAEGKSVSPLGDLTYMFISDFFERHGL